MEPRRLDAPLTATQRIRSSRRSSTASVASRPVRGSIGATTTSAPRSSAARRHEVTSASWSSCVHTIRSPGCQSRASGPGEGQRHRGHVGTEPDACPRERRAAGRPWPAPWPGPRRRPARRRSSRPRSRCRRSPRTRPWPRSPCPPSACRPGRRSGPSRRGPRRGSDRRSRWRAGKVAHGAESGTGTRSVADGGLAPRTVETYADRRRGRAARASSSPTGWCGWRPASSGTWPSPARGPSTTRPKGEPGQFFGDYCSWDRIPELAAGRLRVRPGRAPPASSWARDRCGSSTSTCS